jgi:hypothetical protein
MSAWTCRYTDDKAKADPKMVPLVFEPHDGRALVPIPKRSASPWATSIPSWWIV